MLLLLALFPIVSLSEYHLFYPSWPNMHDLILSNPIHLSKAADKDKIVLDTDPWNLYILGSRELQNKTAGLCNHNRIVLSRHVVLDSFNMAYMDEDSILYQNIKTKFFRIYLSRFKFLGVIEENRYLKKYSTLQQGTHKIEFYTPMFACIFV